MFYPFSDARDPVCITPDKIHITHVRKVNVKSNSNFKIPFSRRKDDMQRTNQEKYTNKVTKAIEQIERGYMNKVVLSRAEYLPNDEIDILATFENLLFSYPNTFVYLWYHPKVGMWMGASPEVFAHIKGQDFNTMSLAGTQKIDSESDINWGQKEKKEQQLVTAYIIEILRKHRLKRITIEPLETLSIGSLIHLKNKIKARLHSKVDLNELFLDLHPTPAVCGIDKVKAQKFIQQTEHYDREFYTGFSGEVNMGEGTALFVNLRCMQFMEKEIVLYAGGGITWDSNPIDEWIEIQNKIDILKTKMIRHVF